MHMQRRKGGGKSCSEAHAKAEGRRKVMLRVRGICKGGSEEGQEDGWRQWLNDLSSHGRHAAGTCDLPPSVE